jgi:hypothetical protein
MPSTPSTGTRRQRHDTQTLVRLDTAPRESGPGPVPKPPEPAAGAPEKLEVGRPANVHLWFQGVREPVRACAELSAAGLSLDAPLPFLELDSEVGCMPVGGGAVLQGRIRSVALESTGSVGVPHLRVTVDLDEEGVAPGEAEAMYAALAEELEASDAQDAEAEPELTQNLDTLPPARGDDAGPRVVPLLAAVMLGLAAGAGVAYAWIGMRPPPPAVVHAPPPPAPVVRTDLGPRVEPPSIVVALAAENTEEPAKSHAAQWLLASDPLAQLSVTPPHLLEEDYEPDPIPPPEVALEDEPSAAPGQGGSGRGFLQVQAEGAQTRVFVPMSGSADGMRQYALTTPGIVLSLPHASALAPLQNYAVPRGLVRRVWLRRVRDGVQVRVITRRTASRVSTSFDPDGLTVVLDM